MCDHAYQTDNDICDLLDSKIASTSLCIKSMICSLHPSVDNEEFGLQNVVVLQNVVTFSYILYVSLLIKPVGNTFK